MKKTILFLAIAYIAFDSTTAFSQAFKKNNFILNGGIGFGVGYGYRNFTAASLGNSADDWYDIDFNTSIGVIVPVSAEFALSNKFGIGALYQHGSYTNTNQALSTANNFAIFGAFHFARRDRIELYTRMAVGISAINFKEGYTYYYSGSSSTNYITSTDGKYQYDLKGAFVKPSFGMRVYFNEHIGFFADAGFGVYSVKTTQIKSDTGTYDLPGRPMHLVMFNFELSTGLAIKF